jgi:hypothetical protein
MLCGECVERTPLSTAPLTLRSLFVTFWAMFKRSGGWVVLLHGLGNLPSLVLRMAGQEGLIESLLSWLVPVFVGAVCSHVIVRQAVSGGAGQFVQALAVVRERFLLLALSGVAAIVISFLFSILFIIPGVMRLLSYALVTTIAVCDPIAKPWEGLQRSQMRMKAHRWTALLGYLTVYAVSAAPGALLMAAFAGRTWARSVLLLPAIASELTVALAGSVSVMSAALYKLTRPDLWPIDPASGRHVID